ncbi:uncharacterized protein isoform X1 [Musca autumnalis]|uniref:uncharacterized protein isoform X1 n=1 Tax=Musca autumnalis TaxID=221902 RepID=UPI003CFAC364
MNNYQNQTPPAVLRNQHQHQPQQHHNNHHFSASSSSTSAVVVQQQHHFTTPAVAAAVHHQPALPPIPALTAVASTHLTPQQQHHSHHHQHQPQHHHHHAVAVPPPPPPVPPQPLISNSLAIRQEIQRFESVHPSIYAIYDLIDLLPITDAQIAQQIRDHVVCIEGMFEKLNCVLSKYLYKSLCVVKSFPFYVRTTSTFCKAKVQQGHLTLPFLPIILFNCGFNHH